VAKIAPSVQAWMAGKATADDVLHGEIRALLAVARAAERVWEVDCGPNGLRTLGSALARLARVSGRKGEGR
jgi:hypothetical protein